MLIILLAACHPGGSRDAEGRERLFADGVIHEIHIDLDDEAWKAMQADHTATVHASVSIDGEDAQDAGIHRKGSSTLRNLDQKAAFVVDFGEYDHEAAWHGVRHLALNNMVLDATMMREHAAAWMFARMGVPAAQHGYARVYVNGERWGLYGVVQSMDQRFLDDQWPDDADGWLYDSVWNTGDLTPELEDNFTVAEDGKSGEPFADLRDLVDVVDATSGDDALAMLQSRFDADELLMDQATEIVLGNYDAYWFNRNNYLLYHATRSDRWHMLSWGPDQAFTGNGPIHDTYTGVLDALCRRDPDCMDLLDADIGAVAHAMVDEDLAGYVQDTWSVIQDDCEDDPRAERACDPSGIVDFVKARPDYVLSQLEEGR